MGEKTTIFNNEKNVLEEKMSEVENPKDFVDIVYDFINQRLCNTSSLGVCLYEILCKKTGVIVTEGKTIFDDFEINVDKLLKKMGNDILKRATIKSYLLGKSIPRRQNVFLMGFKFGLDAENIEVLLKKGLFDMGINYSDYKEFIAVFFLNEGAACKKTDNEYASEFTYENYQLFLEEFETFLESEKDRVIGSGQRNRSRHINYDRTTVLKQYVVESEYLQGIISSSKNSKTDAENTKKEFMKFCLNKIEMFKAFSLEAYLGFYKLYNELRNAMIVYDGEVRLEGERMLEEELSSIIINYGGHERTLEEDFLKYDQDIQHYGDLLMKHGEEAEFYAKKFEELFPEFISEKIKMVYRKKEDKIIQKIIVIFEQADRNTGSEEISSEFMFPEKNAEDISRIIAESTEENECSEKIITLLNNEKQSKIVRNDFRLRYKNGKKDDTGKKKIFPKEDSLYDEYKEIFPHGFNTRTLLERLDRDVKMGSENYESVKEFFKALSSEETADLIIQECNDIFSNANIFSDKEISIGGMSFKDMGFQFPGYRLIASNLRRKIKQQLDLLCMNNAISTERKTILLESVDRNLAFKRFGPEAVIKRVNDEYDFIFETYKMINDEKYRRILSELGYAPRKARGKIVNSFKETQVDYLSRLLSGPLKNYYNNTVDSAKENERENLKKHLIIPSRRDFLIYSFILSYFKFSYGENEADLDFFEFFKGIADTYLKRAGFQPLYNGCLLDVIFECLCLGIDLA